MLLLLSLVLSGILTRYTFRAPINRKQLHVDTCSKMFYSVHFSMCSNQDEVAFSVSSTRLAETSEHTITDFKQGK